MTKEMSPLAKKRKPVIKESVKEETPLEQTEEEIQNAENSESEEELKPKSAPKQVASVKPAVRINILAMRQAAEKRHESPDTLCLLLVGPRQAGKSTVLGTLPDTTLLFTTSDEAHSIETANAKSEASYGGTIIPCIIDMATEDKSGNVLPEDQWTALSPDQAIAKLHGYLDALIATPDLQKQIANIALDSIYSVFKRINDKKNIQTIKSVQKNNFRAQEVALKELLELNQKFVMLQKKGLNVIVTCPAAAEQDKRTGLYDQIEILIEGYRNNLHVVGMFPDICTVGYNSFETEEGEVETGYFLMFNGEMTKAGKKVSGEDRCVNFKPRINGLLIDETPDALPADLSMLIAYKKEVKQQRRNKE